MYLPLLAWEGLLALSLTVLLGVIFSHHCTMGVVFNAWYRMRWLLISLLVIYGWLTPGLPLFPFTGSPSEAGILLGGHRLIGLMALVAVVKWLVTSLNSNELIIGVMTLLHPLRFFGLSTERVAIRISLTLQTVSSAEKLMRQSRQDVGKHGKLSSLVVAASNTITAAEANAKQTTHMLPATHEVPLPLWQLAIPSVLIASLSML